MLKNIWFDMGGVIFRQQSEEAYRRFREAGIDTDRYMGMYGQKEFFLDLETGAIGEEEFCRRMSAVTGREVTWESAQYCWLGYLRDVPVERLQYLLTLRPHYRVCLLSNTNPFVMAYMRSSRFSAEGRPITDYFDRLFCSYEMHVCKPDPAIFLQALAAEQALPEETLFVDDSLKNVQAAEAVGIRGFHVAPDEDWRARLSDRLKQMK
ncbi:MAG: HAD family hydrolase [Parabacteroides sp.]